MPEVNDVVEDSLQDLMQSVWSSAFIYIAAVPVPSEDLKTNKRSDSL
jgi:hypothetical protein